MYHFRSNSFFHYNTSNIRLIATFTFTGLFMPLSHCIFPLVSHNVSDVARCHTLRFTVRDVIYLFIYIPEARDDRICNLCNSANLGDEYHYISKISKEKIYSY